MRSTSAFFLITVVSTTIAYYSGTQVKCSDQNEEAKMCGTQCEPTCSNRYPVCNQACAVNVCQCKNGYIRSDTTGKCMQGCAASDYPRAQPKSTCATAGCPTSSVCVEGNPPKCVTPKSTCASTSCMTGSICVEGNPPRCVSQGDPAYNNGCGTNEERKWCGTSCEPSCQNMYPQICNKMCAVGVCQCKSGYFRNDVKQCVTQKECPAKYPTQDQPQPSDDISAFRPGSGCGSIRCASGYQCQEDTSVCKKAPCQSTVRCVPQQQQPIKQNYGCETVKCSSGYQCQVVTIYCFAAPCPAPSAQCVQIQQVEPIQDQPSNDMSKLPSSYSCTAVFCAPGTKCQQDTVYCIKAPCPQPPPRCVPLTQSDSGTDTDDGNNGESEASYDGTGGHIDNYEEDQYNQDDQRYEEDDGQSNGDSTVVADDFPYEETPRQTGSNGKPKKEKKVKKEKQTKKDKNIPAPDSPRQPGEPAIGSGKKGNQGKNDDIPDTPPFIPPINTGPAPSTNYNEGPVDKPPQTGPINPGGPMNPPNPPYSGNLGGNPVVNPGGPIISGNPQNSGANPVQVQPPQTGPVNPGSPPKQNPGPSGDVPSYPPSNDKPANGYISKNPPVTQAPICPTNEMYVQCVGCDSCDTTMACAMVCRSGCRCIDGYLRQNGACIQQTKCPKPASNYGGPAEKPPQPEPAGPDPVSPGEPIKPANPPYQDSNPVQVQQPVQVPVNPGPNPGQNPPNPGPNPGSNPGSPSSGPNYPPSNDKPVGGYISKNPPVTQAPSCPSYESYVQCAGCDSCDTTMMCTMHCRSGCQCISGYRRLNGVCITQAKCPPKYGK